MNGTANNYLGGSLGIGSTSFTGISLRVGKNITGGTTGVGIASNGNIQNDVTTAAILVVASAFSNTTGFNTTNVYHYLANRGTISHTVTNAYGYFVDATIDYATNNYGFYSNLTSATGVWNLYMNGTAANYLGGALTVNNQITAGNAQATAGSVILRSTYSSGNISNIGTNGSSGGVTISYGAYPASTSTADAFLSGIGFTSFPRSAYAVEADHRWLSAAAALVAENSAVTLTEKMRLYNSGNLVIQDGGTYADAGQRLQVYGDTLMKGSGNTNATNALTVQNSDGSQIFNAVNNGFLFIGNAGSRRPYITNYSAETTQSISGRGIGFVYNGGPNIPQPAFLFTSSSNLAYTSNIANFAVINLTFSPTSGTAQLNAHIIRPTINQTGGANGITRGLYVDPTLSAAADWRSIEWSNNSGWGLYGTGTASNYLGGSLGIAITPTSRLHVAGVGSDNTTNSLIVQNSSASVGLRVADSGDVYAGDGAWFRVQGFSKRYIYKTDVTDGIFSVSSCSSLGTSINMYGATHASKPRTIEIGATYAPTSGTIAYNALEMRPTVNQSSTASGTTRGLYVNPIISSAISQSTWRSIEWSNDAGYGLLGTGTAQNLLNGKLTVNVSVASANLSNSANTISLFGAQTLNIPAATIGTPGVVYAAGTSANYMRFNGNTTMNGDALFAGKAVINSLQFDTTGTVTMNNGGAGGGRALSGLQVQMQFAGATSGTVTKGASILIQGVYPNNTAGTVTFTEYYGLRINDLLEWDTGTGTGKIAMTNKWAIFQSGADDRNYFNGLMLLGSTTSTGERLQVNGTMKVTGATTISSTVKLSGLPTSATGLTAGDIWNNAGVLNIV
jgi:hypothetical protein